MHRCCLRMGDSSAGHPVGGRAIASGGSWPRRLGEVPIAALKIQRRVRGEPLSTQRSHCFSAPSALLSALRVNGFFGALVLPSGSQSNAIALPSDARWVFHFGPTRAAGFWRFCRPDPGKRMPSRARTARYMCLRTATASARTSPVRDQAGADAPVSDCRDNGRSSASPTTRNPADGPDGRPIPRRSFRRRVRTREPGDGHGEAGGRTLSADFQWRLRR
jgi:hypothetical protein